MHSSLNAIYFTLLSENKLHWNYTSSSLLRNIIVCIFHCGLTKELTLSSKMHLPHRNTEGIASSSPQQSPFWGCWGRGDGREGRRERPIAHAEPQKERHHASPSSSKFRPVLYPDTTQQPHVPRERRGWRRGPWANHWHHHSD